MKIAFISSYFYPVPGGAESSSYNLALELVKKGHEVHVYTSDLFQGKRLKKEEEIKGVKVHRCKTWFRYKYYLAFYPSMFFKVIKEDFDIIHFHSIGFLINDFIVLHKKLFSKSKLVCSPYGPFMALEKYSFFGNILKGIITLLEIPVNRCYDLVIQINPFQIKWMVRKGFKKETIKYIPVGISKSLFKKVNAKGFIKKYHLGDKFVLSYVGRTQGYKGLDQVIRVLPTLPKKVVFLAMGPNVGDRERLEKLSKALKVNNRVIFTGKVSEEDKLKGLDCSEIFVFPSEWEAFGIVMIEAMVRGNAIISTKTEGGIFLIKEENGILYNYKNILQLKKALETLIKNKILRNKMKKVNKNKAKEFLWEDIGSKMLEGYSLILRKDKE